MRTPKPIRLPKRKDEAQPDRRELDRFIKAANAWVAPRPSGLSKDDLKFLKDKLDSLSCSPDGQEISIDNRLFKKMVKVLLKAHPL